MKRYRHLSNPKHTKKYDIICIDRRRNKEADKLANLAIDEQN